VLLWLLLLLLVGRIIAWRRHVPVIEQCLWWQWLGVLGPMQVLQDAVDDVVLLPARGLAGGIRLQLFLHRPVGKSMPKWSVQH